MKNLFQRYTPLQIVIHIYGWSALVLLIIDFFTGNLTANPIQAMEQRTGRHAITLLVLSLAVYWVGDVLDGAWARWYDVETRFGGVLDVVCDRACALVFYVGVAWHLPGLMVPVGVYLLEFAVVDLILSLAFVSWPLISPNYFYLVDRTVWRWNWSKPAKAVNSAAFAVLLLGTQSVWLCTAVAVALLALKIGSLVRLVRLGVPVPPQVPTPPA